MNQNPFFNINVLEKYSNPYRVNIIFIAINYILNKLYKNEPYLLQKHTLEGPKKSRTMDMTIHYRSYPNKKLYNMCHNVCIIDH